MGTRELLILILGLAVVAVILRGLYVALYARRSQIRLAIDKNIPQDLDLEELEMSELPNGGARVIKRSLEAVNQQNTLQNELDLGTQSENEEAVPILLDTVEIRNQGEPQQAESIDDGGYEDDEEFLAKTADGEQRDEEQFFDQPPYEDEVEQPLQEDDFDDFTMTAGERIGAPEIAAARVSGFRSRFGGSESSAGGNGGENSGGYKESLFSRFSKKATTDEVDEVVALAPELQADPLVDGYEPAQQALADELPPSEQEEAPTTDFAADSAADSAVASEPLEADEAPGNGDVADINQARESRRPASNGAVSDIGSQPVEPSEVLVVNVMSREGQLFRGADLLQVLVTAGLKHGDMNIFHKHVDNDPASPAIFSVANVLNPGTFDVDSMEDFTTRGVSLFLAMPAVISNRDAFEDMLRTAQQIRAALDGELRDDHRSVMTAQTIEHYRQRINDYELRKLKAAQARS